MVSYQEITQTMFCYGAFAHYVTKNSIIWHLPHYHEIAHDFQYQPMRLILAKFCSRNHWLHDTDTFYDNIYYILLIHGPNSLSVQLFICFFTRFGLTTTVRKLELLSQGYSLQVFSYFCSFIVVWGFGVGVFYWVFGVWVFSLMGFGACDVRPSRFYRLGLPG